jgi:hypothetical protein
VVDLFKIRLGYRAPQIVGQVADQKLIDQVYGPENIVNDQQYPIMVIVPADQQRVDTKDAINDA